LERTPRLLEEEGLAGERDPPHAAPDAAGRHPQRFQNESSARREAPRDFPERGAALLERGHVAKRISRRDDQLEPPSERQKPPAAGYESGGTGGPPPRPREHRDRGLQADREVRQRRERGGHPAEARADFEDRRRAKAADEGLPELEVVAPERLELIERKDS